MSMNSFGSERWGHLDFRNCSCTDGCINVHSYYMQVRDEQPENVFLVQNSLSTLLYQTQGMSRNLLQPACVPSSYWSSSPIDRFDHVRITRMWFGLNDISKLYCFSGFRLSSSFEFGVCALWTSFAFTPFALCFGRFVNWSFIPGSSERLSGSELSEEMGHF